MDLLTATLSTLCIAAGYFYLRRSRVVDDLRGFESARRNAARRSIRRCGAACMLLLGASLFWGAWELKRETPTLQLLLAWGLVMLLLMILLACVMLDVYLTHRLWQGGRGGPST